MRSVDEVDTSTDTDESVEGWKISNVRQVLRRSEETLPARIVMIALCACNSSQLFLEIFHRLDVNKTLRQFVVYIDASENASLVQITMKVDIVGESLEFLIMTSRSTL